MHGAADELHVFGRRSDVSGGEYHLLTVFIIRVGQPFVEDLPTLGGQSRGSQRLDAVVIDRRVLLLRWLSTTNERSLRRERIFVPAPGPGVGCRASLNVKSEMSD